MVLTLELEKESRRKLKLNYLILRAREEGRRL
jgi:hypothetical protein